MKSASITGLIISAAVMLLCCGCGKRAASSSEATVLSTADTSKMSFSFTERDNSAEYSEADATLITLNGEAADIKGEGARLSNRTLELTEGGTFIISGEFNGSVKVAASSDDKLQIVLAGVNITNEKGAALFVKSAKKVFLTLAPESINRLSDGSSYSQTDGDSNIDAAVFSKSNLTVNGSGSLAVNGCYKHAVVSKDALVITGGNLNIAAQKVGLCGKDCVKIGGGEIEISAGSDGIRSDNGDDSSKGYIYIAGGILNINAANDGIQAETVIRLENGDISITAGGGSSEKSSDSSESYKGIKAASDIQIAGGSVKIDSLDDAVHSNNTVVIEKGELELSSGDDGIHADKELSVSGGTIKVLKSYEGLEGSRVLISGGEISVNASDDGINSAGGGDSRAPQMEFGADKFGNSDYEIIISGGYILVNASGDGLDSNGSITFSGGVTLVSGPTDNGNGALDSEDSITVKGGIVVALGSSGMAEGFSSAENQGGILCSFSSQSAGTSFALCDESGKVIVSFTPPKEYQSAAVTAPEIKKGSTVSIVCGGTVSEADANGYAHSSDISGGSSLTEITMTDWIYGSSGGFGGKPGMGGGGGFSGGDMPGGHNGFGGRNEKPDDEAAPNGGIGQPPELPDKEDRRTVY